MANLFDEKEVFIQKLYEEYAPMLERMCVKKVGKNDSAYRDLIDTSIQNTFFLAYQMYDELKLHPNIEAWLKKACNNRLIPYAIRLRERQNRTYPLDSICNINFSCERDISEQAVLNITLESMLVKLLHMLSDAEKELYYCFFVEHDTVEHIAQQRNASVDSVKMMLSRIRAKAKKVNNEEHMNIFIFLVTISLLGYFNY